MKNEIHNRVAGCEVCHRHLPSLPAEPLVLTSAEKPMEALGVDLLDFRGQDWLVVVDRYSGYPFACHLKSTTSEAVTSALKNLFYEWGFPRVIRTDGGPQFRSKFDAFCADNSIIHELSAPYNPRSNGLAEAVVESVKFLLDKCRSLSQDFRRALQEWRKNRC